MTKNKCELCDGANESLVLHSRCHTFAPLRVERHSNELVLICYLPECGKEVGRFKIEESLEPNKKLSELFKDKFDNPIHQGGLMVKVGDVYSWLKEEEGSNERA